MPNRTFKTESFYFANVCPSFRKHDLFLEKKNFFILKQHQLACSLLRVCSRECRAAELARLYVQSRVSGNKIRLPSRITSLSAASVPVIFSSLYCTMLPCFLGLP